MRQNNLGLAWAQLPAGDRAENPRRAITCFEVVFRARAEHRFPQGWWRLPDSDVYGKLSQAMACVEAALHVRTQRACPQEPAARQKKLGGVWAAAKACDLPREKEAKLPAAARARFFAHPTVRAPSAARISSLPEQLRRSFGRPIVLFFPGNSGHTLNHMGPCPDDQALGSYRVKIHGRES